MAGELVLSIFPGLGLLDRAFEAHGYCVVRGPDVIWGGDVRAFMPPRGVFAGVIGGDPCQSHSRLSNLVRAKGLEPSFPDMTPEFERIIREAQPGWVLRENVPHAPTLEIDGYGVHSCLLDNSSLTGEDSLPQEQRRRRRFWFGLRDREPVDLRRWIDFACFELPENPAILGGSAKVKSTAVGSGHASTPSEFPKSRTKVQSVTGRHSGEIGVTGGHRGSPARYTLGQMLELQGLPEDFLDHCPLTIQGKRKAIANGVPQAMGRALAAAIRSALK